MAQWTEDFSDGDFSSTPNWSGDLTRFTIENEELRSNSTTVGDEFYLSTPSTLAQGDVEWRFRVNMKFNTSGANYTDVFLMADTSALNAVANGYFIRIGDTDDDLSLYKRANGAETQLTNGTDDRTHNKNIAIKVTRTALGTWTVSADYAGGSTYESEGTAMDSEITSSSYFGFLITQSTASFHLKHYYDDIYVGPLVLDTKKPNLLNTQIVNTNTLLLTADEPIDTLGTTFILSNGYGTPDNVVVNKDKISLNYTTDLVNGTYTLTVSQLRDLSSNELDTTFSFQYLKGESPSVGDLIITEIMADPSPPVDLPDAEYVELYNTNALPLELQGCTLDDGGSPADLPTFILKSGEYVLLCIEGNKGLFSTVNNVLATRLPTLNNGGDILTLRNQANEILDRVVYTDQLYGDEQKKQGGYSLEKINLISDCNEQINWTASASADGGTPGRMNSVNGLANDAIAPLLLTATIENDTTVILSLNENAVNQDLLSTTNYTLIPDNVGIKSINYDNISYQITLSLTTPLRANETYQLELKNLTDCHGNNASNITTQLIATQLPVVGDLIINELLFNPNKDGVDFIEIYNKSQNYIKLEDLVLARYTDTITNETPITQAGILYPNSYIVVSTDSAATSASYPKTKNQIQLNSLPPMNNDEGVVLLRSATSTLDSVPYSDEQHFELLTSTDGVSLERISHTGQSYSPFLWHSASSSQGYATPGYQNSQYRSTKSSSSTFELSSKVFSPDGDGYQDKLILRYDLKQNGTVLNAYVFALNGRKIDQAIVSEILSINGLISWDGILKNGSKLPVGNYILLLEYFDLEGNTGKKKLAFSVAGIF